MYLRTASAHNVIHSHFRHCSHTAGQEETREAKAEMGGLRKERCEEGRRGGRLEEEDRRQRRVEKTSRRGGAKVAGITSPLTKGKGGRERA